MLVCLKTITFRHLSFILTNLTLRVCLELVKSGGREMKSEVKIFSPVWMLDENGEGGKTEMKIMVGSIENVFIPTLG